MTLLMGNRTQLVWDIPAADSLRVLQEIYRIPEAEFQGTVKELTELLELEELVHKPVRNLSLGERMKVEFAAGLIHSPRVAFLDEPTIGLDVSMQVRIRRFVAEYNRRTGATILLTSHYMDDVVALCKRVIVIHRGRLLYDGPLADLAERMAPYKVITATLHDGAAASTDLDAYGTVVSREEGRVTLRVDRQVELERVRIRVRGAHGPPLAEAPTPAAPNPLLGRREPRLEAHDDHPALDRAGVHRAHVRRAVPHDTDAFALVRSERAPRRFARVPLGLGPRHAGVLDHAGARRLDVLGSRGVHLRGPDRPACPSPWAPAGDLARAAVRLHPRSPGGDPPGRRERDDRAGPYGRPGLLGRGLLRRLPARLARRGPAVQRGGCLMIRYARLLRLFFRTELQYELEYRLNLILEILQTVVVTATSVGAVLVLFSYTTVLNGWDLGAMLVLLGCFYLVQGFGELVLQPSFEKVMEHIRLGTLDFALLKPASAQFLVTLRHFRVVQLAQMGLAAIARAVALGRIPGS